MNLLDFISYCDEHLYREVLDGDDGKLLSWSASRLSDRVDCTVDGDVFEDLVKVCLVDRDGVVRLYVHYFVDDFVSRKFLAVVGFVLSEVDGFSVS